MKLFFLDIDGTIALPGTAPSPLLTQTIAALRAQGDKVFLCTGRTLQSVPEAVKPLGSDGGIFSAGGLILGGEQELGRAYMPEDIKASILTLLDRLGAHYVLECEQNGYWGGNDLQDALAHMTPGAGMHSELLRLLSIFHQHLPISRYQGEPVFKIVFLLPAQEQADQLRQSLPAGTDAVFFRNLLAPDRVCLGEISDARINKGAAMYQLCRFYGLTAQDCVAYGDSMNDATVLQAAGEGIAMGNAGEEVKKLANRVCGSCAEDGLALDLQRYVQYKQPQGEETTGT